MDRQMEIEEILANIEDMLEHGKSVPFSDKTMIDREEMFDLITDVRLKLPSEIEQSKWVLDEKNRILTEAQREAEEKIRAAEEERARMINARQTASRINPRCRPVSRRLPVLPEGDAPSLFPSIAAFRLLPNSFMYCLFDPFFP